MLTDLRFADDVALTTTSVKENNTEEEILARIRRDGEVSASINIS